MELRRLTLVIVAACSGGKPKVVSSDDAKAIAHSADAAVAHDAAAPIPPGKGDVSIRVEWHDVPVDARAPKPCGPDVAPTTTWGIPDAVVTLAGSGASSPTAGAPRPAAARVVVTRCLTPRVQVASDSLTIASGSLTPLSLALDDRPVELPIAGHEVTVSLSAGRHELVAGDAHAWVVAERGGTSAVTDASGVAILRDVPSGVYPVTAWLPSAKRSAKGEVTVMPGALAEVTLQLQPSP